MAVKYAASIGVNEISIDGVDLTSAIGAGSEFALAIPTQGTPNITWQTIIVGTITSITVLLEGSLDGDNWSTIDTSTSITGEIRNLTGNYNFIRINNSAVVGGAGDTLTASFVYSNRISAPASITVGVTTVAGVTNAVLYVDGSNLVRASSTELGYNQTNNQLLVQNGSSTAPAIARIGGTAVGIYFVGNATLIASANLPRQRFNYDKQGEFIVASDGRLGFSSTTDVTSTRDAWFSRSGPFSIQLGENDAATDFTLKGCDRTVADAAGNHLTVKGGAGTAGNANGGDVRLEGGDKAGTGVVGSVSIGIGQAGTNFKLDRTITAAGTTGARTINKIAGTVNFAAGAATLVVTNSLVTTDSIVICTVRTNDATAIIKNVVPAAGSFTITLNAVTTAETSVGFLVTN